MSTRAFRPTSAACLGIEAGGTHTVALHCAGDSTLRQEFGPANLRLVNDRQLRHLFQAIRATFLGAPPPAAIAIGMAGARTETDRARIRHAAAKVWPNVPCHATNDLETGLAAAQPRPASGASPSARILVLSGTGSCCYGQDRHGRAVKVGGWGHFLGDKGSGYEIGLRALKAAVYYYDRDGQWPALGGRLLRAVQENQPEDLVGWVQHASKDEIAALAIEVFAAAAERDPIARDILEGAAATLIGDAIACANRLARRREPVLFVLAGGVLLKQPGFAQRVSRGLKRGWPTCRVQTLDREGAWGAIELARRIVLAGDERTTTPATSTTRPRSSESVAVDPTLAALPLSPTEQRNPASMRLDRMSLRAAIELMIREDEGIPPAIRVHRAAIEHAIRLIVRAFKSGGRLLYVGAGTSGRLGVLDASECPPTFRTPPEMVQGIMAGGQSALWRSIEGAEDSWDGGAQAIVVRAVGANDVVAGIAASGRTPFVWGALAEAKKRSAATILIAFNPYVILPQPVKPTVFIAPNVGPEILTGSTRLKAGTATKMILNMLTTLAMVQLGKVKSNLMIDVDARNVKLRDRAIRIVQALTGVDRAAASAALEGSGWVIKAALARAGRRLRPG